MSGKKSSIRVIMYIIRKILLLLNEKYPDGDYKHYISLSKYGRLAITVYCKNINLYYFIDIDDYNKTPEQFVEELSKMVEQDLELRKNEQKTTKTLRRIY